MAAICYYLPMSTTTTKPLATVQLLTIDANHTGQRVDNFLITKLKGVPKTHIYQLLRKGQVRINKGRIGPDYRLQSGDIVRIPPVRGVKAQAEHIASAAVPQKRFAWLEECILYEDEAFLAIDKPAGLAVHGGSGISLGLIETLRALRPDARFLELVHRLDRETSGCLLVAKKRVALLALHSALRDGGFDKRYLALLKGQWQGKARRIEASLEKSRLQSGERRTHVSENGKKSASRFTPKRIFAHATLVEIKLLTGRTHQARVHAAHIDQPIAGDEKYGDANFNRQMRSKGLDRLFLHAAELRFAHPVTAAPVVIVAPLPVGLAAFIEQLGGSGAG